MTINYKNLQDCKIYITQNVCVLNCALTRNTLLSSSFDSIPNINTELSVGI